MEIEFAKRIQQQSVNLTEKITDRAKALNASDMLYLSIGIPYEPIESLLKTESLKSIEAGQTAYTTARGIVELREIIAAQRHRYQEAGNIMITAGVSEAVFLVLASLINPNDEVIIISPSFFIFDKGVELCGGKSVFIPLQENGETFYLDIKALEAKITPKTKLIILNSPHNPTGWVADKKTVQSIVGIVEKHKLLLLSDEIYKDFIYDNDNFVSPENFTDRVIIVDGISKTFSATGLRIGWIVADKKIIERILPLHQLILLSAPAPFQYAANKLFRSDLTQYVKKLRDTYGKRRDLVTDQLRKINHATIVKPNGAFYIFPKIEGIDSLNFAESLLEKTHTVVVPGLDYGKDWNSYIRIAFCQPEKVLLKACERIVNFVNKS